MSETDYFAEPDAEGRYPSIQRDCRYCDGKGRFIKPAVLRELLEMEAKAEPSFGQSLRIQEEAK